jgi:small-conductance mechanosensitive channel
MLRMLTQVWAAPKPTALIGVTAPRLGGFGRDQGKARMKGKVAVAIDRFQGSFFWLPDWASALIVLVLICAVALFLHAMVLRFVRNSPESRWRFSRLLLLRSANPTRGAIVLFVLAAALPVLNLPTTTAQTLIAPLSAVFILLIGWCSVTAVGLSTDLYLGRFKTGFENALTRKHVTQVRLLRRAGDVMIVLVSLGAAMMTLPTVRQYGVSLFASAGAAGIVVGLAARSLLSNLLAGIQIAITQPVKIEDSVVINGEWGWVEDITSTYLVVRIWDWRRLIVPLSWFLEQPFENWTRDTATIIGTVLFFLDYRAPIEELRQELNRLVHASKLWDGNVVNLQVVDATAEAIQLRVLVSASDASRAWDLRCEMREKLIAFVKERHPDCLPRRRLHLSSEQDPAAMRAALADQGAAPASSG